MAVLVRLLGGFAVQVDGAQVPDDAWSRRHAAQLVQLLALSDGRRLHREQALDVLWPELDPEAAAPRLHKAAHYARRALGDPDGLVLRRDLVALFPERADLQVDLDDFVREADAALADGDGAAAVRALDQYRGPVLPEEPYLPWLEEPRARGRRRQLALLRLLSRWDALLAEEPADEQAHLAVASALADRGDRRGALLQLERLEHALQHELGSAPGPAAARLRAQLESTVTREPARSAVAGAGRAPDRLFGRRDVGDRLRAVLDGAGSGRGATVLVCGPPGVGKSAVLEMAAALARRRGWKLGRGAAAAVEGPWPYAPVLQALNDLCRSSPALLDALGDDHRAEIGRALAGRELEWKGESAHQRLFVAATALVRVAAAGSGVLLTVDDVHEADEASLRLLHYLARCAVDERVVLVLGHRRPVPDGAKEILTSMTAVGDGHQVELAPLAASVARRMLADRFPDLSSAALDEVTDAAGGLPFALLELGRARTLGTPTSVELVPVDVARTLQSVALMGQTFGTDEWLEVADTGEEEAWSRLETACAALVVEPVEGGFRFRHPLLRESLLEGLPQQQRRRAHSRVADALAALGRPPRRVAHHLLAAGLISRAVPYVMRAIQTEGALGAYRDVLELIEGVRGQAGPEDLPVLLARRGDVLMALGDPAAVPAYLEAAQVTTGTVHRLVRARLARAAAVAGDLSTAQAALADLALEGDEADAPLLLARGNLAWFTGDMDTARDVALEARRRLRGVDDPWQVVDLVGLQGLLAHQQGEWFASFRRELRHTQGHDRLAGALFDAHLCVAENLLYGREPYDETLAEAEQLRERARHAGAVRGTAFATALIGEAALLSGDLSRAEAELSDAVALHAEIDATGGQAHSLQRLAEVRLAQGRDVEARSLLEEALLLARWSTVAKHLLQRIFGTMIRSAPDPRSARALVDRATSSLGETDSCHFCTVMLALPAAGACAEVGDHAEAQAFLAAATRSMAMWGESSWRGAVLETEAALARAEGDEARCRGLLRDAAAAYTTVGHLQEAARCSAAAEEGLPRPGEGSKKVDAAG